MTRSYTIPRNFRRVIRGILKHGTYTCCQLSYDVGQRVSIAARNRAWNDRSIFIWYAKWKPPLVADERGRAALPILREKLYENRSYVRAWPRSCVEPAVGGKRPKPAELRSAAVAPDRGPSRRPVDLSPGVGKRDLIPAPARRRSLGAAEDRSTCGRSRPSGNPHGSANMYTSRARRSVGRSGTPPCRTHT